MTFTAPAPGARLIVAVSSWHLVNTPTGYTQDVMASGYNAVYVFSKLATGAETSVTINTNNSDERLHAVVYERDDCQTMLFNGSGISTTSAAATGNLTVPAATGWVVGVVNSPGGSAASTTWNQGLTRHFSPTGTSSNSGFAQGALPAAGSRSYNVSGLTASSNNSVLAVVGYGSTDTTAPTVPGGLHTTAVTGTQINVAWTASTDAIGVTGYGIYKDGVKQGGDQVGLSYSFAGLTVGTSYTLEVDARDAAGNRSPKASLVVSTDATPPTVPGNLRTTAIAHTSIAVAWDASTDALTGVAGYGIYLDTFKQGGDVAVLAATLPGLVPGQTYTIEVDAKDGAGNRSPKAQLVVQATPDTVAPTAPTDVTADDVTPYSFTASWGASSDDVAVALYGVYVDGDKIADTPLLWYPLEELTPATEYLVQIDAVDSSSNRSAKASLTIETPPDVPPQAPTDLHATAVTYTSISVAWNPAVDDVMVTGYDVMFDDESVATDQAALTSSFPGLVENTSHTVRVWTVDSIGQRSTLPAELTLSTLNDTPPTPPQFTTSAGEETITVAWEPSGDDFSVTHYDVRVDGETVWSTPGTDYTVDGPVVRRRTVTTLAPGTPYDVRVVAVDTIGQESADNTAEVVTTPTPFFPLDSPIYRLGAWTGNARDAHGVDWIVEDEKGWSSTPPVSPVAAPLGGVDGAHPGAGRYGKRVITLEGVAIATSRAGMLAAKQRLAAVLHPRQLATFRVEDARYTRQARVRLVGQIGIVDQGDRAFSWTLTLSAADPRRYATTPTTAAAVIASLPGETTLTLTMAGNYPAIPARIRLYGPVKDFSLAHEESGTLMRAMPGTILQANPGYSLGLDLATRMVWAYVPPEIWPDPRPGRAALAHLPAWFMLLPGQNTLTLSGDPVPGQPGTPRIAIEAYDAWV
ncbi:fibronectin type III domain-containing protein [Streptosporangium sp. NPDC002524]|uniref:fibronectin type III domain-containing protein n=1 Tax=Streptosporangium sp. NPDC002524 TaxID=3154537 RepID=UPI00332785D5